MNDIQIIITGTLVALSCSILGVFLVLRKMAMVGDAISHAVLPGIILAYLISGSRDSFIMVLGAGAIGIFTTFLIEYFHTKGGLQSDASIGVTFTWLFALGVIMITLFAGKVDLDQDCVLYGEIAYVPLDLWYVNDVSWGPRAAWTSAIVLVVNLILVLLCYKELKITTFDPAFATVTGISAILWHYIIMGAVSFTTIVSFESVGAILVVAFMVGPAATAYLLTQRLKEMLFLAGIFSISACALGYYLAVIINGSIAGAMSTMIGIQFITVLIIVKSNRKVGKVAL